MTLPVMIYGLVLAILVAGAAYFLDRGLRALGRPTRWVWIGALAAGGLAPFFPRLVGTGSMEPGFGGFGLPIEPLYEIGVTGASVPSESGAVSAALEGSLGVLWILGSALVLMVFAVACLRLHRQRVTWETRKVGGEDVLLSDGLGPAVLGLIRPRIVLPGWALALRRKDLEMVILHEKEHREARDPALLAVGLLLTALSPWNPVLWWTLLRLRLAVEGDCDRRVLAGGIPPGNYARLLFDVGSRAGRTPALVPALTESGHSAMEKRLMMIRSATKRHRAWATALAATAGIALIVLACDTPIPQEPDALAVELASAECPDGGELREAVAAGEMTAEEARAVMEGCAAERGDGRGRGGRWEAAGRIMNALEVEGARLREAAETGEMTAEEAREAYWAFLGTSVREAVGAGEMTAEEGRGMVMRVRLGAAVESGEMTREEAREAYRERMARARDGTSR